MKEIKWTGGECPVYRNTIVMVKFGKQSNFNNPGKAKWLRWTWDSKGKGDDITSYCVVDADAKESPLNVKETQSASKIDVSLVPRLGIEEIAKAMMAGLKKPGRWPYCWRDGGAGMRRTYLAAAMRHIQADLDGEDFDKETSELLGQPVTHLGCAGASLAILSDMQKNGVLIDNRPHTSYYKNQEQKMP